MSYDVRHRRDRLGVVDDRGSAVQTDNSREGRLDAWNAALAFERFHQRRLFADFVRACAGLRDDLKFCFGAEDVFAEKALRIGVGNGLLHDLEQVAILAAQIDEAHLRTDGQAGDDGSFDNGVGIVQKDQVILAGARLALVAIHQNVLRLGRLLGHERPLHPRRKACAAATAQIRGLHLVDDPVGPLRETFPCGFVAAELDVLIDIRRALAEALRDNLHFIGMRNQPRHCAFLCLGLDSRYRSRISGTLSRRQLVVKVVIHLDRRSPAAGADALHFFERETFRPPSRPCDRCRVLPGTARRRRRRRAACN